MNVEEAMKIYGELRSDFLNEVATPRHANSLASLEAIKTLAEQFYIDAKPIEPFELFLGSGRVLIATYSTPSGVRGVVLRDTKVEHEVGSLAAKSDYDHTPIPGEVYIRCGTRESALVLLEQVARVVASFSEPVFPQAEDSPSASGEKPIE